MSLTDLSYLEEKFIFHLCKHCLPSNRFRPSNPLSRVAKCKRQQRQEEAKCSLYFFTRVWLHFPGLAESAKQRERSLGTTKSCQRWASILWPAQVKAHVFKLTSKGNDQLLCLFCCYRNLNVYKKVWCLQHWEFICPIVKIASLIDEMTKWQIDDL